MRLFLAAALPLLAAPALTPQQRESVPAATPAGKPVDCLSLTRIRESRVRDDRTIDFIATDGKVYRNTLPYACPSLGFEGRYAHESTLGQICAVDTITVLTGPGISRGATCGLGKFQPVTLAKR